MSSTRIELEALCKQFFQLRSVAAGPRPFAGASTNCPESCAWGALGERRSAKKNLPSCDAECKLVRGRAQVVLCILFGGDIGLGSSGCLGVLLIFGVLVIYSRFTDRLLRRRVA